jgi:hypothetical protein
LQLATYQKTLAAQRLGGYAASMEKQRLLETLAELRAELAEVDRVDPETLAQLKQVTDEVQQALDKRGAAPTGELEPATTGLKKALLKFEADHPQLSGAVGNVADALAAMGF